MAYSATFQNKANGSLFSVSDNLPWHYHSLETAPDRTFLGVVLKQSVGRVTEVTRVLFLHLVEWETKL